MSRFTVCITAAILMVTGGASAETISLLRDDTWDQQSAGFEASAAATGNEDPYYDSGYDDPWDDNNMTITIASHAQAAVGVDAVSSLSCLTTAYTNTAMNSTSYAPSIGVVTGGPIITTLRDSSVGGTGTGASINGCGGGASSGTFIVDQPSNPEALMIMEGSFDIIAEPSESVTYWDSYMSIGSSYVFYGSWGCWGYCAEAGGPGVYFYSWEECPHFSEFVEAGQPIAMSASVQYTVNRNASLGTLTEWPNFNLYGLMTVNTIE